MSGETEERRVSPRESEPRKIELCITTCYRCPHGEAQVEHRRRTQLNPVRSNGEGVSGESAGPPRRGADPARGATDG